MPNELGPPAQALPDVLSLLHPGAAQPAPGPNALGASNIMSLLQALNPVGTANATDLVRSKMGPEGFNPNKIGGEGGGGGLGIPGFLTPRPTIPPDVRPSTFTGAKPPVPGPRPVESLDTVPGTFDSSALGKSLKTPGAEPEPPAPKPFQYKQSAKETKDIARRQGTARNEIDEMRGFNRQWEDMGYIQQNDAGPIMERFKGHPQEGDLLKQKLEQLKIRVSNYGEGPKVDDAKQQMKMLRKRLREIK